MMKYVWKRILAATLTLVMVVGMTACGDSANNDSGTVVGGDTLVSGADAEEGGYVSDPDRSDEGYVMVWNDEFDGDSLDTTKWDYQYGTGSQYGLDGWGNSELQYYTDREENVRVEDGKLIITAIKEETPYEDMPYTSGRIRTLDNDTEASLFSTTFGRVEARIKMPIGEGLWPAFWMLPVDPSLYNQWASSGEIDIMEARGRLPEMVGGTLHYGKNWPNNIYKGKDYVFEGSDISEYHLYSVEWEPGVMRWFVDDECYYTMDNWYGKGSANAEDYTFPAPFDVPFYILLNMAVGGTFDSEANLENAEFPAEMYVDYVRVYHKEEGYDTSALKETAKVEKKDTTNFETYSADYPDGDYIVDKQFTTMNTDAITDTGAGIVPTSKDWQFAVGAFGGAATACLEELDEGTFARVDITSGGSQTYAVQLIQHFPVAEGYTYEVTFDAKASEGRTFVVSPSGDADNGWAKYGSQTVSVGPEMSTYSFTFKMNSASDPTSRLEFNLGQATGSVWIGNVKLTNVEVAGGINDDKVKTPLYGGNVVYNGTFDQGIRRVSFWHTEGMEIDVPDFVVLEDGTEFYGRMAELVATAADAKLYQTNIQLKAGKNYNMSFDLAGEAAADMTVTLTGDDGTVYFEEVIAWAGGDTQNYSFDFVAPEADEDLNTLLTITLGEGQSIKIDNITLVKTMKNAADK